MADYEPIIKASSVNRPTYGRLVVRNGTLVNVAKTDSGKEIGSLCADAGNVRWIYGSAPMFVNGGGPEDGEDISNPISIACLGDDIGYDKRLYYDDDYGTSGFKYQASALTVDGVSSLGRVFDFYVGINSGGGIRYNDQLLSYSQVQDANVFKNALLSVCTDAFAAIQAAKEKAGVTVSNGKFTPLHKSQETSINLASWFSWKLVPTSVQIEYQKSFELRLNGSGFVRFRELLKTYLFYFPLHKKSVRIGVRCYDFSLTRTAELAVENNITARIVMNVYSPIGLAANQCPTIENENPIYGKLIRTSSTRYFSGGEEVPGDVWIETDIPSTALDDSRMLYFELMFEVKPPSVNEIVDATRPYHNASDEKIITSLTFVEGTNAREIGARFTCKCDFHCWFDGSLVEGAGA